MARFEDKVIVVTGASRGIGGSIAQAFLREGATVVGLARSANQDITGELAKRFVPIAFDLGDAKAEQLHKLVADVVARTGKIDGLVNNAGIIRRAPAVDFTEQDWDDVIRVNLTTPFFLTQAVAKWWLKDGGRERAPTGSRLKIVNIASMLSFQGGITIPAYTASKHGMAGITKALANEWASLAINVNAIAPGYIATENTRPLRENETRNRQILERIPQGGWGDPDDISGTTLFLASTDADYLNGAVINVDGGWLAR
ncbi:MAG: SDR family oxidoreductase [Planctomycetota bacterium]|nr:SDR family oxidoreductase [Planctomycetota bacterium]